ncbi:MAG: helix-turn-helix domain-containing protein, partial [Actinomycetota bacterium]
GSRIGPGAMERARRWLEDHLHEPYSLAATARAAAISERSLLRHFAAAFGQTPLQMLHELRITRARMLLETSYLPVEAIAERCGWRDPAMLRQAFRRATGTTPAAYRERYRLRVERRRWGSELPR